MKYPHVMGLVFDQPWWITQEMMGTIATIVEYRSSGGVMTAEEIQAATMGARTWSPYLIVPGEPEYTMEPLLQEDGLPREPVPRPQTGGAVAVLPLFGPIAQRANLMTQVSGGTSTERFGALFRQVMGDAGVAAVVFDVDSPGGAMAGVEELADEIRAARGRKPIVAVANSMMASAAYGIASSADTIVTAIGAMVGSIGAVLPRPDVSEADAKAGIRMNFISSAPRKLHGNPHVAMDDDEAERLQSIVDQAGDRLVKWVARNRGVSVSVVRKDFGQGGLLTATEAVEVGMADRIGTLRGEIQRLMGRKGGRAAVSGRMEPGGIIGAMERDLIEGSDESDEEPVGILATVDAGEEIATERPESDEKAREREKLALL